MAEACTDVRRDGLIPGVPTACGLVAGLVPLTTVVVVDPEGWYPFGPAKHGGVLVSALATIAVAGWFGDHRRLPRFAWLWTALLAWLALAALFGEDRWYAWIGTPERRLGWLTWLVLAGCAWAGSRVGVSPRSVRWFTRGMVGAALWCGAYALVELWWRAPIETSAVTSRVGGPFGSAAYLGAALCLLLPVAAAAAADRSELVGWRVAGGVALVTGPIALVATGTRAAWIALGLVGLVVAVVRRPSKSTLIAGVFVLVIAVAAVGPRLAGVVERDGAGGASRLAEWEVAARVVAQRPLLGVGPEGYRIAFADGVDPEYERSYGRDVLPDRAHSALLDVAAIGGVPAAVLYAGLLASVAIAAWGAIGRHDVAVAGLAAGAAAYGAQQMVLFPLAELDPVFWLAAGIVCSHQRPHSASVLAPHRLRARWVSGFAGVAAVGVFVVGVIGVAADRSARRALDREPGSPAAVAAAERATALRPDVLRYHLLESAVHGERQSVAGARAAVAAATSATDLSPLDPVARLTLAEARTRLAQVTGDSSDLDAARVDWERLVADDPNCGRCWFGLAMTRRLAGDAAAAEAAFTRAAALGAAP